MNQDEVREVVRITLDELISRRLISNQGYQTILRTVGDTLVEYFKSRDGTGNINKILVSLSDDPYIDVIYLQFRDGIPMERIAEIMDKDVRTIKRNKKRLIITINEMLSNG